MILDALAGSLAVLSLALLLWQWIAARRFPLHQRTAPPTPAPGVTLFKPLHGADAATEACLRSWFEQDYAGPVQILFGVESLADPAAEIARRLMREFPSTPAELVVCGPPAGVNPKVAKWLELERSARHGVLILSDADVRAPRDLVSNVVAPLADAQTALVTCLYRIAQPATLALRWEAFVINVDFWSQVLQAQTFRKLDFALGAVMAVRRSRLEEIGGLAAVRDCLADDYQLGHRLAARGHRVVLSPAVVECWSDPLGWAAVWRHQLRWARTVRVCAPVPFFFSLLANPLLWPLAWFAVRPGLVSGGWLLVCMAARLVMAADLSARISGASRAALRIAWMAPLKDLLHVIIWASAFLGNTVEWRGERLRVRSDGTASRASRS